jgi:PEP-CTERM motif
MKSLSHNALSHRLLPVCALLLLTLPAAANPLYIFSVDPSGLSGQPGYLDMQFNPGILPGTQLAYATASANSYFSPAPWIIQFASSVKIGDVRSELEFDHVYFTNDTPYNDYFIPTIYGHALDYLSISFDGPAITSPDGTSTSGSTFAISFFDQNMNPVLTNNPDGFAALIQLNPDGTTTPETFPNTDGGPSALTVIYPPPPTSTTPEPTTMLLVATGLSGIIGLARQRAHQ